MDPINRHREIVAEYHIDNASAATLVLAEHLAALTALLVAPSTLALVHEQSDATVVHRVTPSATPVITAETITPTPTPVVEPVTPAPTPAPDWTADAVRYLREQYAAGDVPKNVTADVAVRINGQPAEMTDANSEKVAV